MDVYQLLSYLIDQSSPMYGGRPGFQSNTASSISNGDSANTKQWEFPNHLGTHVDFPYHFFNDGQTLEDFPLDYWVFSDESIQVLEIYNDEQHYLIDPDMISPQKFNDRARLVLLKTGCYRFRGQQRYWKYNPGISLKCSQWIKKNFPALTMIGIDTISVSSYQHRPEGRKVHKLLLNPDHPVLLIEDMNLEKITTNSYFNQLWIVPLMVKNMDGCPCTVIADVN